MKTRLIKRLTILLLVAVFGCSENVEVITYDTPQVSEEGEKELIIEVIDTGDEAVTNYDISIQGPTSATESGVSNSQYTFTDLQSGTYSITVTKAGYVEAETETDIELPEEAASGFSSEIIVVIRDKTPLVSVDNSQDTTVETAPSENPGEEGQTTRLTIPAGSFPDDVVNDDGTVDVSATRSSPNDFITTSEGIVDNHLLFEPLGTELNNPVEVSIPITVPVELQGVEYVLMPGNIQVELEQANQSAKVEARATDHQQSSRGNAKINNFLDFNLVANVQVEVSHSLTEPVVIATSGCGEGVNAEYSVEIVPPGQVIRRFAKGFPENNRTVTRSRSYNGVDGVRLTVRAQHKTKTIQLVDINNGDVIVEETINLPVIHFNLETSNCHNSGGG